MEVSDANVVNIGVEETGAKQEERQNVRQENETAFLITDFPDFRCGMEKSIATGSCGTNRGK